MYISHARTLDELRAEVVADLDRRVDMLNAQAGYAKVSAADKARLACAIREFEGMRHYWSKIVLARSRKREAPA